MLVEHDIITASISGNEIRGTVVADNDSERGVGEQPQPKRSRQIFHPAMKGKAISAVMSAHAVL